MPDLPPSDAQVLALGAQGYGPQDIAYRLGMDDSAVRNAVARVRRRLGARTLEHAVQIHRTAGQPDA